jgi:hypothetical protein
MWIVSNTAIKKRMTVVISMCVLIVVVFMIQRNGIDAFEAVCERDE